MLLRNVRPYGEDAVDVLLRDGVITAIDSELCLRDSPDQIVEGRGAVLLPGLVDLHTHLREPGREDAETVQSGSRAAALGGYTAVFAMPNTDPAADIAGVVEQVWRLGRETGLVDVQPIGAVTVGRAGVQLAELGAMADSAARVRVFSDDGSCVADPVLMRRALEYVKAFDGVIAQHAEEPRLTAGAQMNEGAVSARLGLTGWPAVAEEAIIARDVLLAGHVGSRLHVCHVSTAGSVEILRWAKSKGWQVTAEVTPHHLLLTDDLAESYDPVYKVNPPLRTAADVEALRLGLADGTIDCVATDHAPHALEDKETEWGAALPGMLGLQTALPVVIETMVTSGLLDWRGVADRMSTAPGAHRCAGRPRRDDRRRSASQSGTGRPRRTVDRVAGRARVQVAQHPVRGSHPAGARARDVPAGPGHGTGRRRRRGGSAMTRVLLVVICLVFFAVALWGMRAGWRHRSARQSDLPPLPVPPAALGEPVIDGMAGLYVGSAYATSWQDRVLAGGLGARAAATARLYDAGFVVDRDGEQAIFVPAAAILAARLAPGLAGKVVGAGGLLVIRWRLGDAELDTGFRADDKSGYPNWVRKINERVAA